MKKALAIGIVIIALTVSYIAYYTQITVPQKLVESYENCKQDASIEYSIGWLEACDNQKPFTKECKTILTDGFPWQLHRLIKTTPWEVTTEDYQKYREHFQKISDCSCKKLPKLFADELSKNLEGEESSCLSEFEAMTRLMK